MASKHAVLCIRFSPTKLPFAHSYVTTLTRNGWPPVCLYPRTRHSASAQRRWKSTDTATVSAKSTPEAEPRHIKSYTYEDILALTASPSPTRVLIDVRTPSETASGLIPTAKILNITANPEGLFLSPEEFEERFGWEKPQKDAEILFYCKAGVRSRVAARMARDAGYEHVGEFPGSWDEWVQKGGKIGREWA
ncbi:hypothetical protein MMC13_003141 [Lambiella insularis]|nr:hypothetical protein [Lambiella insularis]